MRGVGADPVENRGGDYLSDLPPLRSRSQVLAFATDLENTAVAAYVDALGIVATDHARVRIAAILVTEAEHLAATRTAARAPGGAARVRGRRHARMSARTTRRQALGGAALATAATLAPVRIASAQEDRRKLAAQLLADALRVELTAVVAYEAIANSGRLGERATLLFRQLLDQERQHVEALTKPVEELDGTVPQAPRRADIRGLARVRSDASAVRFATALEERSLRAFSRAMGELRDTNAIRTVATITGAEGGHLVLLRDLAGEPLLASAFEDGSR